MIALSTIHESHLTKFHRNHFILTVSDLKDLSIFKDFDLDNENHFSLETAREVFPNASNETLAGLLLTTIKLKLQEGERNFLFVFNDENKTESLDIVNGLIHVFNLVAANEQQAKQFEYLKTFALEWTHLLIAEEDRKPKITFQ